MPPGPGPTAEPTHEVGCNVRDTNTMSSTRVIVLLFGGTIAFTFAACGGDTDGECTDDCAPGTGAVECHFLDKSPSIVCGSDVTIAAVRCQDAGGSSWDPLTVCEYETETTGEDPIPTTEPPVPFPPDGAVTLDVDSGERVIDQDLFEALHDDPALLRRDSTRVDLLDSGYFHVSAQGTLSDVMGWQHGDVFLSLNDYSLQGMENVSIAYQDISHSTYFTLTIQRDRAPVVLRYRVE